jgi:hypothetical protein
VEGMRKRGGGRGLRAISWLHTTSTNAITTPIPPYHERTQALHWSRSNDFNISDRVLNTNNIKSLFEFRISESEPGKWTPLSIPTTKIKGGCNKAKDITQAEEFQSSIWVESQDGRAVVYNQEINPHRLNLTLVIQS